MPCLLHGRCDALHDGREVAWNMMALNRGGHGSATAMPHHYDEPYMQMLHRILQAAENNLIDDIAGRPNHEEIAQPLIKHDLRRDARVAAGEYGGIGVLRRFQRLPAPHRLIGMREATSGEPLIAVKKPVGWRPASGLRRIRPGPRIDAPTSRDDCPNTSDQLQK